MPNDYENLLATGQSANSGTGTNPYLDLVQGETSARDATFKASATVAIDANPDEIARQKRVASLLGQPLAAVQALPKQADRMAKMQELEQNTAGAPALRQAFTNADFAKLAHDDTANLAGIERTLKGTLSDIGVVALKGAVGLPQAFVGLADIPTFGYAGKALDAIGVRFNDSQKILEGMYSPAQQQANQNVQNADGFIDTLGAVARNPSVLATTVGESLPQMLGGAVAARGLLAFGAKTVGAGMAGPAAPGLLARALGSSAPVVAGAAGEGIIGAGSAAEQTRSTTADGTLSAKQVAASIFSGAGTATFSLLGGKVAQKLGIDDIDTALASGSLSKADVEKGLLRTLAEAGVSEGVLEELPQSAQEQVWQNIATDRPILEGVGGAAALGLVSGAVMGGTFSGVTHRAQTAKANAEKALQTAQALDELDKLAAASKVRERDADTFEGFVAQATADGPVQDVYIAANTLAQSGMAEQIAAVSPSVAEQFQTALATGGDVRIPLPEYAARIAGTEYSQALLDHLKTDPLGMSRAEAQEYMQSQGEALKADMQRAVEEKLGDTAFKQSQEAVKAEVLKRLNDTGRFTAEKNELDATLIAARTAVRAAQLGITPQEMFQRNPLNVSAQSVMSGQVLEQGGAVTVTDQTDELTGLPLNSDGTVTVYHHTSAKNAEAIQKSGTLKAQAEPDVYVTSRKETDTGYGDTAVPIRVKPEQLQIDDEFPDGRMDFRINAKRPGGSVKVTVGEAAAKVLNQGQRGSFNPATSTITLLKNADLSTFLHESGHFFFENDIDIAGQLLAKGNLTEGEQQIVSDVSALLRWNGIQGDINEQLAQWTSMDFEERRSYHERTAESFEHYLFTGKAPSIELQRAFQTFRAWLLNVYKSVKDFLARNPEAGKLNDEVRGVFDRMLATNEEIALAEQSRSMMPLFATADQGGMTSDEFASYHDQGVNATQDAIDDLQARGLRDMQWLHNAKGREIKRLQKESAERRRDVQMAVRAEVMSQPVYRAWQFLTGKVTADDKIAPNVPPKSSPDSVDPAIDSLLPAIAKLGGISRESATQNLGVHSDDHRTPSGVFGKPVFRKEGGMSADSMAEALAELGYLPKDEHGKHDLRDLEERLSEELSGKPQYSVAHDYSQGRDEPRAGEGYNLQALTAGRLDLTELNSMGMRPEIIEHIKNLKMTAKNGIHPDLVAEMFGFSSGDELVRTLAAAEVPKVEIEGLTDSRMLQQYGELATPEAISRAADQAIHNEARAKFVTTQANALAKATGQRKILASAAKEFAATVVSRLTIRNIKPSQYAAAESRASKAAQKAMQSGDLATAASEARNQVINTYLTKEAYAAREEAESTDRYFKKIVSGKDDVVGKTRDMDIVNAARAVLGNFGYGAKAKTAVEYLKAVEAYDPGLYEVLRQSVEAAQASAKPVMDMTVEELRGLRAEIESLWHLAKRNRTMEVDGDMLDRQEVAEKLRERLEEIGIPDTSPGDTSAITPEEERAMKVASAKAIGRRVESWVDLKDGNNKMGDFRRYLWTPIKEAADRYRADKARQLRDFRNAFEGIASSFKRGLIAAPELNYTFGKDSGGVAMNEVVHAILHTGNESNKRKLLLGRGWATERADGSLDTTRWDSFVNRMIDEGRITKATFDFAQKVWDGLEAMKPLAQKAHRDAYGKYFSEVTADALVTPFGTYRGGYVPATVDSRIVKDNELKKLIEEGKDGMAYAFPGTSKGFTKSRVDYNKPLMLDLRTLPQHIDKVLLFSHMEMPVRDAAKLIASKGLSSALNKVDPAAINVMLMPWLNRTARQQVTTPVAGAGWMMRMLNTLRNRTSMATMFANISNTAQQVSGFALAGLKVKPSNLLSATAEYMRSPSKLAKEVADLSPYMANRMSDEVSAMMGDIDNILLNPNLYEKTQEWTKRHTFFMQSAVDNVMGPIIWKGAYNEALAEKFDPRDAARIADAAVRQTQGSTLPEDVSRIETGPAYARLFTQFAGYFNMQANLLGTELGKVSQEMGMRKGMGKGFYIFLMGFAAPALVAEMIAQAFRGGPDDDDKDGSYLDDWLMALLVYGPIRNATAFVPFVGQVTNSAIARFNNNPTDDKMSVAPVVGALEAAAGVPVDLYKAAVGEGNAQRTVKDLATLITITTGLPASVAARPISYIAGDMQGKVEPTSAVDRVRGLATGAASPQSRTP